MVFIIIIIVIIIIIIISSRNFTPYEFFPLFECGFSLKSE